MRLPVTQIPADNDPLAALLADKSLSALLAPMPAPGRTLKQATAEASDPAVATLVHAPPP